MGLNKERKKICLSLYAEDLDNLDNLVEFLTKYHGYRFNRTMALTFLIKFYRDNFKFDMEDNKIKGQTKLPLPF